MSRYFDQDEFDRIQKHTDEQFRRLYNEPFSVMLRESMAGKQLAAELVESVLYPERKIQSGGTQ